MYLMEWSRYLSATCQLMDFCSEELTKTYIVKIFKTHVSLPLSALSFPILLPSPHLYSSTTDDRSSSTGGVTAETTDKSAA